MSSRPARARPETAPEEHRVVAPADVPPSLGTDAPANDDERTPSFSFFGDPLIGMAVATIVLLMVLAALMSAS